MKSRRFTTTVYAQSREFGKNRGFGEVVNAQKRSLRGSRRPEFAKTMVFLGFPRFFALQALALSRMIGLTKEEIEHFRTVLFFGT
jgi:hypothetical protein